MRAVIELQANPSVANEKNFSWFKEHYGMGLTGNSTFYGTSRIVEWAFSAPIGADCVPAS
jgi:hypothetical protein